MVCRSLLLGRRVLYRLFFLLCLAVLPACRIAPVEAELPMRNQLIRDQLVIYSDMRLPARHRLLDELAAGRDEICERLKLPMSDEPIQVYLFEDEQRYRAYMAENHPEFAGRRAIFAKNDTTLKVFAYWGPWVGEDLRHEVTHGYIHAVIPEIPLWLDEGLAEYFEVGRGRKGFHRQHLARLLEAERAHGWKPDLARLERLQNAAEMSQLDYAESWLWVHFLVESSPISLSLLQDQLARLRMSAETRPLGEFVDKQWPDAANQLIEHLHQLENIALAADSADQVR